LFLWCQALDVRYFAVQKSGLIEVEEVALMVPSA